MNVCADENLKNVKKERFQFQPMQTAARWQMGRGWDIERMVFSF